VGSQGEAYILAELRIVLGQTEAQPGRVQPRNSERIDRAGASVRQDIRSSQVCTPSPDETHRAAPFSSGIREFARLGRVYMAYATVFEVLRTRFYGDPKTAFRNPYSIALSETVARHYFGDGNPSVNS